MYTMQVSVTERQTFDRCKRQWILSAASQESLGPVKPATALELGKTIHDALAQWSLEYQAWDLADNNESAADSEAPSLPGLFEIAATRSLVEIKRLYRAKVGADISDVELTPYYDMVTLGRGMMKNYQEFYGSPLFEGYTLVAPEQEITVDIPGTWYYDNEGNRVCDQLTLRLDKIIEDSQGRRYIVDHKTYSQRPKIEDLSMTDQFKGYVWGLRQTGMKNVVGVAYDGMWKRESTPKGRKFDELFMRCIIEYNDHEIEEWGRYLPGELQLMHMVAADPMLQLPTVPWNGCYSGTNACRGFQKVCDMMSKGEDAVAYKRQNFVRVDRDKLAEE